MSTSPTLPSSHPTSPILPNLTLAGSALARVLGGADMPCAGLAPMAGITDMPTRLLASECGAAFCVTEMISAKGYVCAPENREAIRELVQRHPDEGPLAAQLFGHEPGYMAEAVRRIQDEGFSWIDINMGCPAPKIAGNGDGSALMDDPVLAGRMVAAAVKASRGPVTVKIRSGRDENRTAQQRIPETVFRCDARRIPVRGIPETDDEFQPDAVRPDPAEERILQPVQ